MSAAALANYETDEDTIEVDDVKFTRSDIETKEGMEAKHDEILACFKGDFYYTKFHAENRVMDLEETGKYAAAIFENQNERAYCVVEEMCDYYSDDSHLRYREINPAVDNFFEDLQHQAENIGWSWPHDKDELVEQTAEALCDMVREDDDSTVKDMFSDCDKAEVVFYLIPDNGYVSDNQTTTDRYNDWDQINLGSSFINTLPRLGYTLEQYIAHSGNKKEVSENAMPDMEPRLPLATLDELKEIVENSGSSYFHFAVYAKLSILDLLEIDLEKPVKLSKYAICAIDAERGTFYEITKDQPIVLRPHEGVWHAFKGEGPIEWCCMTGRPFEAEISN